MIYHILTVEAALDALDRHDRSRSPRVSLHPAPPNVIHMPPPPYDYDLPTTEFYRLDDVHGSA
jgi:hypothetical protein